MMDSAAAVAAAHAHVVRRPAARWRRLLLSGSVGVAWVIGTVLAVSLLGSCTSSTQPDSRLAGRAAHPPGRVLVLSSDNTPVVEQVVAMLARGGQGSPPLPPLEADVLRAEDASQAFAAMRRVQPQLGRYRAIYTTSLTFARAAQIVSPDIPIVFEGVDDPLPLCLVDSLQRPGRNATGYMHFLHADEFKMLELLHDAFPALREVLFLVSGDNTPPPSCDPGDSYWKTPARQACSAGERGLDAYVQRRVRGSELDAYAQSLGLRLRFLVSCEPGDLPALAQRYQRSDGQAGWLVPWHSLFDDQRERVAQLLSATRMPAVYPHHGYARAGGLMALSAIFDDGPDRSSVLTLLQVLGGADPATLPVQAPRGFNLLVNARTAGQLPVPPSLLTLRRADQIIH